MASLTFVQAVPGGLLNSTSQSLAYNSNTTAGSLLLLFTITNGGTPTTCTDSLSNTWTKIYRDNSSAPNSLEVWMCNGGKGGADTVTFTQNEALSIQMVLLEYTGQNASPVDTFINGQSGAGTSVSIGPITASFPNETLIAVWGVLVPGYDAGGSDWTLRTTAGGSNYIQVEDMNIASTGNYTATGITGSGFAEGGIVAFKSLNSEGGATTSWLSINLNPSLKGTKH